MIIIIVTPIITKGLRSVNKDDKLANYDVDGVGDYNMRSLIKEEKLKNKLYEGWVIYMYMYIYMHVLIIILLLLKLLLLLLLLISIYVHPPLSICPYICLFIIIYFI